MAAINLAQVKLDLFGDIALMPEGGYFVGQLNAGGRPHGTGSSFHRDGTAQATLIVDVAEPSNSGRWIDGGLYGLASQRFIDGDIYSGAFWDGLFTGQGCFTWADGAHFEGEFFSGERCGFGVEWGSDGRMTQSGRWEKDQLVEWRAVPIGCITQGKMLSEAALAARLSCPFGFLVQLDLTGRFFIGEINSREQPHGRGASFFANGQLEVSLLSDPEKQGRWVAGAVCGRAVRLLECGDRLEGFFCNDQLEGVVCVQRARRIPIEEALLHLPSESGGKEEKEEKQDGGNQAAQSAAEQPAAASV